MTAFSQFFGKFLKSLWKDIVAFFQSILDWFVNLWKTIISNFSYYKSVFDLYSQDFDAVGWIFFALSVLLLVALIGALAFVIVKVTKRWYIAKRKVKDKIVLLREIEKLNNKVIAIQDEANKHATKDELQLQIEEHLHRIITEQEADSLIADYISILEADSTLSMNSWLIDSNIG